MSIQDKNRIGINKEGVLQQSIVYEQTEKIAQMIAKGILPTIQPPNPPLNYKYKVRENKYND